MTTDLNDRIAKAKGWRLSEWYEDSGLPETRSETPLHTHWYNPSGEIAARPNFTGTLEGVAGMLRELQEHQYRKEKALLRIPDVRLRWSWRYVPQEKEYACDLKNQSGYRHTGFASPHDRPSDCVGEAWLSVFEKKKNDSKMP